MRRVMVIALSAAATALTGACGGAGETRSSGDLVGESGEQDTSAALTIEENTATALRGRLITADGKLRFSAEALDARAVRLGLDVNGKVFDARVDGTSTSIDGHDSILTSADRNLLRAFIDQFEIRFAGVAVASRDASLNGLALYLSEAPEGYVHKATTRRASASSSGASLGDTASLAPAGESVICLKKGTTVTAVFTSQLGTKFQEAIVVGSKLNPLNGGTGDYSCMGKCGAGCTDYWFTKTGYTKDCLNHDACSRHFSSTKGSRDPNCGDEYSAASYDFTHSSNCTGN